MTIMEGYVKDNNIVLDSELMYLDGKKVMITIYDEGENPYDIKKPIPEKIQQMLKDFVKQTCECFGDHVKRIILYGSYARGDYREYSDIDIMVLVDYDEKEIVERRKTLSDLSFDIGDRNDLILISPIMQNIDHFDEWMGKYPFYDNVNEDGVLLYES